MATQNTNYIPQAGAATDMSHGEINVAGTAAALPDISCKYVVLKAKSTNSGIIYVGSSTSVTAPTGSTNTTAGFPLAAGESEQFFVSNLKHLAAIAASANDDLLYFLYK